MVLKVRCESCNSLRMSSPCIMLQVSLMHCEHVPTFYSACHCMSQEINSLLISDQSGHNFCNRLWESTSPVDKKCMNGTFD